MKVPPAAIGLALLASLASGAPPPVEQSASGSDPARVERLRAAKMPALTQPVLFDTPAADAILAALEVFPPDNPWNQVVSGFSPQTRVILTALKRYGMFVADNGIEWAVSLAPDERIPALDQELRRVTGADFEVVMPPRKQ